MTQAAIKSTPADTYNIVVQSSLVIISPYLNSSTIL